MKVRESKENKQISKRVFADRRLQEKSRKHGYAFLGYPEKENKNEKKKDISIKSRGQCKRNATEYSCVVNSLTMTFNSNANDLLCH